MRPLHMARLTLFNVTKVYIFFHISNLTAHFFTKKIAHFFSTTLSDFFRLTKDSHLLSRSVENQRTLCTQRVVMGELP